MGCCESCPNTEYILHESLSAHPQTYKCPKLLNGVRCKNKSESAEILSLAGFPDTFYCDYHLEEELRNVMIENEFARMRVR